MSYKVGGIRCLQMRGGSCKGRTNTGTPVAVAGQ
ncbi:hypothetical protein C8E87_0395 [Paractinoplanes brasiliensis]|uniref:Uncharacterized protein n=1 Tax=Paractinoplanes brasiliensis TaxID=52695 RepID=A0A4R6JKK0_9ACTN|nr:hypothetical protein C8E87_0395 [Actinoplanes brasiliensis]